MDIPKPLRSPSRWFDGAICDAEVKAESRRRQAVQLASCGVLSYLEGRKDMKAESLGTCLVWLERSDVILAEAMILTGH